MAEDRTARAVKKALQNDTALARARKARRAAEDPAYEGWLARQGRMQARLEAANEAKRKRILDKDAEDRASIHRGESVLAEAERRQAEIDRIQQVVQHYAEVAKEVEQRATQEPRYIRRERLVRVPVRTAGGRVQYVSKMQEYFELESQNDTQGKSSS